LADALAAGPAAETAARRVGERLRGLPDHGIGFGLLRHLNPDTAPGLTEDPAPAVGFNYLGRFTAPADTAAEWAFAPESAALGSGTDPGLGAAHALDLNAVVHDSGTGPRLVADWSWPDGVLTETEVRALADAWFAALSALVTRAGHAPGTENPALSHDELALSQEELALSQEELALSQEELALSQDELDELAAGLDG
ncbi:hypothetical protein CLM62_35225, partial [Streptomyces sp. SA15]|uniref:hypothetical protein n=1 Tax=Streptomyces sp. SA15 TaxID=934019 RepID=UPI000BD9713C